MKITVDGIPLYSTSPEKMKSTYTALRRTLSCAYRTKTETNEQSHLYRLPSTNILLKSYPRNVRPAAPPPSIQKLGHTSRCSLPENVDNLSDEALTGD